VVLAQILHAGNLFDFCVGIRFGKVFFKNFYGAVILFILFGGSEIIQITSGKGQAEKDCQTELVSASNRSKNK
jgi:hypothetical protein